MTSEWRDLVSGIRRRDEENAKLEAALAHIDECEECQRWLAEVTEER